MDIYIHILFLMFLRLQSPNLLGHPVRTILTFSGVKRFEKQYSRISTRFNIQWCPIRHWLHCRCGWKMHWQSCHDPRNRIWQWNYLQTFLLRTLSYHLQNGLWTSTGGRMWWKLPQKMLHWVQKFGLGRKSSILFHTFSAKLWHSWTNRMYHWIQIRVLHQVKNKMESFHQWARDYFGQN